MAVSKTEKAGKSEVVIIGGGLSGLAAAWELEQRGLAYTLIEVKARLGGSILSPHIETDAGAFVLDQVQFLLEKYGNWPFLAELGIPESAWAKTGRYRDGDLIYFRDGTQTLTDALARRIRASILYRMAVSSIGFLQPDTASGRLGICLENGVLIESAAAIIAAPARYAERMLRTLVPEAAFALTQIEYEQVARVHLGYSTRDLPNILPNSDALRQHLNIQDTSLRFLHSYHLADRVPPGATLIRAGVRLHEGETPEIAQGRVQGWLNAQTTPLMAWSTMWPEADPLGLSLPEHWRAMADVRAALPENIALIGSDYRDRQNERLLDMRIRNARREAARIASLLAST